MEMEGLDYWRLCDEVTIFEAAALVAGGDPTKLRDLKSDDLPVGYEAAEKAITRALESRAIDGSIVPLESNNGPPCVISSTVKVASLREWLGRRGVKTGFFFPLMQEAPEYLNPNQPYYAPKLAAAVGAWEAITADPDLMRGVTAKKAMIKWLRRNADRYGLTKDDGSPNELGIEEVAKVANWADKGGAPKTPGG